MSPEAIFVRRGDGWQATELGRGPWDPQALHGGAPAALLVHAFEAFEPQEGVGLARITYEFVRPVPLARLHVEVQALRPGRRVRLLEGTIRDGEGTLVTRARALQMRLSELGTVDDRPPPFSGPDAAAASDFGDAGGPMFATHAMDIRFVQGGFRQLGPATAWFRLRHPVVADQTPSPFERAAAAGDFGNGISTVLSWEEHLFINPDLTLYLEREPRGEWVALQSETRVHPGASAVSESVLWDEAGRIGRATQALLVSRR
ncbi:MAG: thioesterase family protein [Actinomycetota bacterium]|nr:thioesterase family protein [Actinomycetota bacterium]